MPYNQVFQSHIFSITPLLLYQYGHQLGMEYRTTFQKIYKEAGWDEWPSDALRKTFCSYHKEAFSNMELTNKIAGHGMDVSKKHYENTITSLAKPEANASPEELKDNKKLLTREYAQQLWELTPDKIK